MPRNINPNQQQSITELQRKQLKEVQAQTMKDLLAYVELNPIPIDATIEELKECYTAFVAGWQFSWQSLDEVNAPK